MELFEGPHRPSPQVADAAARLALEWRPRTSGGRSGERLGRAPGASVEFAEHRAYTPGDDVRHVDWRAFARSDQLVVRSFREEVAPRLDVLLDTSRSLAVSRAKAGGALDLAALWLAWGRAAGFAARLWAVGDAWREVRGDELAAGGLAFDSRTPLERALERAAALPAGGARVLVSDLMSPAAPRTLLVRAFGRAAAGIALAVWDRDEVEPSPAAAARLVDAETGATREVELDRGRVERYRARFARWRGELEGEARRAGVAFVPWTVPADLVEAARERLGPLGIVVAG